jgi:hypothetical protein
MRQTWEETAPNQQAFLRYLDSARGGKKIFPRGLLCRLFHRGIMYAGGSTYRCASCLREFVCPWAERGGKG